MSPYKKGWGFFIEGVRDGKLVSDFGAFGQSNVLSKWEFVESDRHFYLVTSCPMRPAAGDKNMLEERKSWKLDNFKFEDETTIIIKHSLNWRP